MGRRIAIPILLAFFFGLLGQCIHEETFECESAVARIAECCPEADTTVYDCEFNRSCVGDTPPFLREDEAECVESLSCDTIRAEGGCANIGNLGCLSSEQSQ